MFVRKNSQLPQEPTYATNLTDLGYKLNSQNQIVKIANPDETFSFYLTDNDRANMLHKEAMHTAVRDIIKTQLESFGVKEIYLTGEDGTEVTMEKREGKHLPMFVTEPSALKKKKDVIVVVGEHMQDPGIWAWRTVTGKGGLDGGSAVGMVKHLQKEVTMAPGSLTASNETTQESKPGIIILNPGQQFYSHAHNTAMTQVSWLSRRRPNALASDYKIDRKHNFIPGHTTAAKHLETVFCHVLPGLVRKNVRLYVVGIADGAENFIKYLDAALMAQPDAWIGRAVVAMAFMDPTHAVEDVQSEVCKDLLLERARSYVKSDRPMGAVVNLPGAEIEITHWEGGKEGDVKAKLKDENLEPGRETSEGGGEGAARTSALTLSEHPQDVEQSQKGGEMTKLSEYPEWDKPSENDAEAGVTSYAREKVSCPTFSAGVDTTELIWPAVMKACLGWFGW